MRHTTIFTPTTLKQKNYTVGNATFRMVALPGMDNFMMGNDKGEEKSYSWEQPKHPCSITPFALAEYPVTQELWQEVVARAQVQGMLKEPALPLTPAYFQGACRPVEQVSWKNAQEFCRVLNLLLDKPKGHFRLPTEAEWEYAARTGTRETLYAGSNQLGEVAWYDGNNEKETMPVGLLLPNAFGLYDLSGNVWEWCEDDWHDDYKNHPGNSAAWKDGETEEGRASSRVLRGGSWSLIAGGCRCAFRIRFGPDGRGRNVGFRLAAPV